MSPSPSRREKKVYVCVKQFSESREKRGTNLWYAIDNNNSEELEVEVEVEIEGTTIGVKVESLSHVFEQASNSPKIPEFVAWKSFIFSIGGSILIEGSISQYGPSSDVLYIDTRSPQEGWKRGPPLIQGRWNPYCVVYDGMIWALDGCGCGFDFGCLKQPIPIYAESLLPFSSDSRWFRMDMGGRSQNEAPINIIGHAIYEDKLFVHGTTTDALHSYDFRTDIWKKIESEFSWQHHCASIDEIMYLVEGGKFMGFDLINHQWYKGVGLQQCKMLPPYIHKGQGLGLTSSLVHLGNGTLCLLWIATLRASFRVIHCTKFTVHKQYDDAEGCFIIKATVKSFKVYKISRGVLVCSVAVDPGEEESDHDKEEESARDQGTSATITKKEEVVSAKDGMKLPRKNKKKEKNKSQQKIGN